MASRYACERATFFTAEDAEDAEVKSIWAFPLRPPRPLRSVVEMLIPSIDLQGGAVVQLVQGERLAIRDDDVFRWVKRFEHFPKVQVIDLDAAMSVGDNLAIVRQIAAALSCRVGG